MDFHASVDTDEWRVFIPLIDFYVHGYLPEQWSIQFVSPFSFVPN